MGIFDIFKKRTSSEIVESKPFTEDTLKVHNQIRYIQDELGITEFTDEESKRKNSAYYFNTKQQIKLLSTDELKTIQDKLWKNPVSEGDDGKFLDLNDLISDELEYRGE